MNDKTYCDVIKTDCQACIDKVNLQARISDQQALLDEAIRLLGQAYPNTDYDESCDDYDYCEKVKKWNKETRQFLDRVNKGQGVEE